MDGRKSTGGEDSNGVEILLVDADEHVFVNSPLTST
jgi:hypothetical protein